MPWLDPPDPARVFLPDASLAESFVRGAGVYVGLLALFRLSLRRQTGSVGVPDVLLVVLVSECVSASLGGAGRSVANGLAAVAAVLAVNYALDYASWRWPPVRRWLEPDPLPLVVDGRPVARNLARERIGVDELLALLRQGGVDDIRKVKRAVMESEGKVSVVPADDPPPGPPDLDAAVRRLTEATQALRDALAHHRPAGPGSPPSEAHLPVPGPHPGARGGAAGVPAEAGRNPRHPRRRSGATGDGGARRPGVANAAPNPPFRRPHGTRGPTGPAAAAGRP